MKRLLLLPLLVAASSAMADPRDDVLDVVTAVFDGMRAKDAALLRAQFSPDARLGTTPVEDFISGVTSSTAHLDEVTFDETVLIDAGLAMAWTPYNIFIDGEFHHCGVDLFVMKYSGERWLIHHLDDTRRTEGCEPERRQ